MTICHCYIFFKGKTFINFQVPEYLATYDKCVFPVSSQELVSFHCWILLLKSLSVESSHYGCVFLQCFLFRSFISCSLNISITSLQSSFCFCLSNCLSSPSLFYCPVHLSPYLSSLPLSIYLSISRQSVFCLTLSLHLIIYPCLSIYLSINHSLRILSISCVTFSVAFGLSVSPSFVTVSFSLRQCAFPFMTISVFLIMTCVCLFMTISAYLPFMTVCVSFSLWLCLSFHDCVWLSLYK